MNQQFIPQGKKIKIKIGVFDMDDGKVGSKVGELEATHSLNADKFVDDLMEAEGLELS